MNFAARLFLILTAGMVIGFFSQAKAQTTGVQKPDILFWKIAAELNAAGYPSHSHFTWSDSNLEQMVRTVPTLKNLFSMVSRNVKFKAGDTNGTYAGFTTELKDKQKTIYVQVYYAKPKKNIDVALTVGHELIHAIQYNDGTTADWKKSIPMPDGARYAECQGEVGAYTWSSMYWSNNQDKVWFADQIKTYQKCVTDFNKKYKL